MCDGWICTIHHLVLATHSTKMKQTISAIFMPFVSLFCDVKVTEVGMMHQFPAHIGVQLPWPYEQWIRWQKIQKRTYVHTGGRWGGGCMKPMCSILPSNGSRIIKEIVPQFCDLRPCFKTAFWHLTQHLYSNIQFAFCLPNKWRVFSKIFCLDVWQRIHGKWDWRAWSPNTSQGWQIIDIPLILSKVRLEPNFISEDF